MHFTAQQILLCPRSRQVQHAHFNAAVLGEFVGVRQQVREQLLQTQTINLYPIIAVETINEINAVAARSQQRLQYVHCRMRQSRRLQDHVHLVLLVWIERRSAQRFCNAEDASERCADFHADVGKEFTACIVGLDGFIAGFDQLMRLFAQLLGAADRLPLRLVLLVRQRIEINQKDDHQEAESEQLRLVRMQQQIEGKPPRYQAGRGNRASAARSQSVPTA